MYIRQSDALELTERYYTPEADERLKPDELIASARNLVLKDSEDGVPRLQLAKIGEDEWLLDFWTMAPLQAFGIALVVFEHTSIRH